MLATEAVLAFIVLLPRLHNVKQIVEGIMHVR